MFSLITTRKLRSKKVIFCGIMLLVLVALPSFSVMRGILALPLLAHQDDARGESCYVLAGGGALWERLAAAADLYHLHRVKRILVMQDSHRSSHRFTAGVSWNRTQWALDYLAWLGIPRDRISLVKEVDGMFGTLAEARSLSLNLPAGTKQLVIVSSAPHMRRSILAFRRSLPTSVTVVPYAASPFATSHELYHPLWIEYVKLLVYFVVA
jgi:uncharacterized SAM-binding protein YcdF (DUF218 family)